MTAQELRGIIGENIKSRRRALDMTQVELAEATGLTQASIAFIENGRNSPQIDTLAKIAVALRVQPDMLLREGSYSEVEKVA